MDNIEVLNPEAQKRRIIAQAASAILMRNATPVEVAGECDFCQLWASQLSKNVCHFCEANFARAMRV